jgi:hypothetical protein
MAVASRVGRHVGFIAGIITIEIPLTFAELTISSVAFRGHHCA